MTQALRFFLCVFRDQGPFWKGFGSILNLFGKHPHTHKPHTAEEDARRIASDWKRIGGDLRWSLNEYGREQKRIGADTTK